MFIRPVYLKRACTGEKRQNRHTTGEDVPSMCVRLCACDRGKPTGETGVAVHQQGSRHQTVLVHVTRGAKHDGCLLHIHEIISKGLGGGGAQAHTNKEREKRTHEGQNNGVEIQSGP